MTPDDVRAAAEQLVHFHDRFAPLFGKEQAQDHAYDYVKGLMTCPERKSIEPIALTVGHGDVSGLQKFINSAPWQSDDVQAEVQAAFADELAPSAAGSPIGVVGVIDESAFAKKGRHSAGVARQHNGRLGKEDNCQVGVFLIGVTPDGVALLDHRLYLHESWYDGAGGGGADARRPMSPRGCRSAPSRRSPPSWSAASRCCGLGAPGLGHRRRGVRHQRRAARRAGGAGPAVRDGGPEGQPRSGPRTRPVACPPYSGRGQPPKRPTREAVRSVAAVAAGLAGRGVAGAAGARGGGRPAGLRVRGGAGLGGPPPPGRARRSGC